MILLIRLYDKYTIVTKYCSRKKSILYKIIIIYKILIKNVKYI